MKGCHEKDAEQLFLFSGRTEEREMVQERLRLDLKKEKDTSFSSSGSSTVCLCS